MGLGGRHIFQDIQNHRKHQKLLILEPFNSLSSCLRTVHDYICIADDRSDQGEIKIINTILEISNRINNSALMPNAIAAGPSQCVCFVVLIFPF